MYYEFNRDDAYNFARHIGIETFQKGNELHFKICPFCKGKGQKGHMNHKTFAININDGVFNCFLCGVTGNMITLAKEFNFTLSNSNISEYYNPQKKYKELKTPTEKIKPKKTAIDYLKNRGIAESIIEEYQITTHKDKESILVFPFFDENGKLQFIKYRNMEYSKGSSGAKEWCEAETRPILFGMMQCKDFDRIIITEGQIDSLSVATAGINNAVSVPTGCNGFTWIPYCWNFINKFNEIIVFGDYDIDKRTGEKRITLLKELQKTFRKPIKHVRVEDYRDKKDANELLQTYGAEHIKFCIENAIFEPAEYLQDLADIDDLDECQTERLCTGIEIVDRNLKGGLPFGGITIIAGKCGEGKSTLASQIIINAFDMGYKTFVYSGELQCFMFKSWMMRQIAGNQNIIMQTTRGGYQTPLVKNDVKEKINKWLKGKCLIYDDGIIPTDSSEMPTLSRIIEDEMAKGTRVFLIDNLMTALDLENMESSSEYETQGKYLKHLARLSRRYNALIILVAHKRKESNTGNENDDISGSAYISNNASLILSYGKPPERKREKGESEAEYQASREEDEKRRILKITKDRLLGASSKLGYEMKYDAMSKRIYSDRAELLVSYGWEEWTSAESSLIEAPF